LRVCYIIDIPPREDRALFSKIINTHAKRDKDSDTLGPLADRSSSLAPSVKARALGSARALEEDHQAILRRIAGG
jgi:hypothetical protein